MNSAVIVERERNVIVSAKSNVSSVTVQTHAPKVIVAKQAPSQVVVQAPPSKVVKVGIQGPPGPTGATGSGGDLSYQHIQGVAASTWVITHNLNKYPSISIVDSGGAVVEGSETYNSLNQMTVVFSAGFSGKAYLN